MKGEMLIYTPGIPQPKRVEFARAIKLEEMQAAVGGYIEPVPQFNQTPSGQRCLAFCNEDGIIKKMPFNQTATEAWLKCLGPGPFRYEPRLLGPVILLTGDDEFLERA